MHIVHIVWPYMALNKSTKIFPTQKTTRRNSTYHGANLKICNYHKLS